jgi:hypothetical protein
MAIPIPGTLSLNSIVDVEVLISPLSAPRSTFNQGLIIGSTNNITAEERLREYENAAAMLEDGFVLTDPEYIAASIYFSQSPSPDTLWVGRQDLDAAETCVEALEACRQANFEWYMAVCLNAVYADHIACAAYTESATPPSLYGFTTSDAGCLTGTESPDDIFTYLKSLNYSRTIGQYATTQDGEYPNNIYAIVAIMGYAMGQNSGLANSAFTLKFKREIGISTEQLTTTQLGILEGNYGNAYLSYGNYYSIFEQGKMSDGTFFDEKINLDMLVNNIQLTVMDLLYQNPKIPQTDAGVTQLMQACNDACDEAVRVGFLGPGTWTGVNILNLKNGDPLPDGYLVQAEALATQSQADREARKSVPIYVAIKESGAIHSVLIGVYCNR